LNNHRHTEENIKPIRYRVADGKIPQSDDDSPHISKNGSVETLWYYDLTIRQTNVKQWRFHAQKQEPINRAKTANILPRGLKKMGTSPE
jgi:hypothetical protein